MKKRFLYSMAAVILLIIFIIIGEFVLWKNDSSISGLINATPKTENKTVVAVVDGIDIYKETIDFLATGEKIALKNSAQYNNVEVTEEIDTDKILQEQIRDAVVLAEAKSQGLEASEKEAEEYTLENYEIVKEVGGETYNVLLDYMTEMNLTEKEYLEICTSVNRNKLTRANLYDKFTEGKTGTYDELVAEYEMYVAELIKKADIEYK